MYNSKGLSTSASAIVAGIALSCAALSCVGCGSGASLGTPVSHFPSKAELQGVAESTPDTLPPFNARGVEIWQIESPIPAPGAPYASDSAWDRVLLQAVSEHGDGARAVPALRCAAQEAARFYTQYEAFPDEHLRHFLTGRCGSTLLTSSIAGSFVEVSAEHTDAEIAAQLEPNFKELLADTLDTPGAEVGVGYARGHGRAAVILLSGVPHGRLKALPPLVEGNTFTLEGQAGADAAWVLGFVNHGQYGVRRCESDRTIKAPAFRVTCPMAAEDEQTWVEIVAKRQGQVLLNGVLNVLVRRRITDSNVADLADGNSANGNSADSPDVAGGANVADGNSADGSGGNPDASLTYTAARYGDSHPVHSEDGFRRAVLLGLNQVRKQAGLSTLTFESVQSRTNQQLVPHFFDAAFSGDTERTDLIALGLLAGWDVNGMIRDGGIYSGFLTSTRDAGKWLGYALDRPVGRWVLLEPHMSRVAIGGHVGKPSGLMALITTYSFFGSGNQSEDRDQVVRALMKTRAARKLPTANILPPGPSLEAALASIASGEATSGDALEDALESIVQNQGRSVSGWVVETNDLRHIPFQDSLLQPSAVDIMVGVTHYKPEGGAWGQYAVLFVTFGDGGASPRHMASRKAPNTG